MKVLVMANGYGVHTEKWLAGLSMDDSFELYLLTMDPNGVRDGILKNPRIKRIFEVFSPTPIKEYNNYQYLLLVPRIIKIIKELKPDIISTVFLTSYGFMGAPAKGKALLCHFMIGSDIMLAPSKNIIYRWIVKFALRRGDCFVVPSQTMFKRLNEIYKITPDKLLIQQYGVNDEIINYPRQKKEYDFVSSRTLVGNSNIPLILEIFSHMDVPKNLMVLNDGPFRRKVVEASKRMSNIKYFGTLPYEENIDIIAKSKFYVSLVSSDGVPLSLIEAMALGTIPVLSDIEPNREWVKDGLNGFLIDINNLSEAIKRFNYIASLSDELLDPMRKYNIEIIKERASFKKNMTYFNQWLKNNYENFINRVQG